MIAVPVTSATLRIPLAGSVPAGQELFLVKDDSRPFALIGRWADGSVLVGSEPAEIPDDRVDPFDLLVSGPCAGDTEPSSDGFVGGGWFGFLGFSLGAPGEGRIPGPPSVESAPAFSLARYDHLLRRDGEGQWWFEALPTPEREAFIQNRLAQFRRRLAEGVDEPRRFSTTPWRSDPSPEGHARAVQACRERIRAGDLYQANIALRLHSELDGEPADLFAKAVSSLRPDRAAFFSDGEFAIASLSPELFLHRRGDRVRSAPIKGTRARGADESDDGRVLAELTASKKDLAENTMIVDLVRNDLGRVCLPGSVEVTSLAAPQAHSGVWHLVSEVAGRLMPGTDDRDLLAATFPPGSVTGAPKLAALETIAELESNSRQVFTGAIGFSSPHAGLELNVAIRTFEITGREIWLDVGGGIVADSDPASEAAEAAAKALPLLNAIGASLDGSIESSAAPPVMRLGPRPLRRPRRDDGIFETLLVADGEAVNLDRHLTRLGTGVAELFGTELPPNLADLIRDAAAGAEGESRLRIDFRPGSGIETSFGPVAQKDLPIALVPVTLPGGLGSHKWRDRLLVEELSRAVGPATPLLVDLDGHALEAAWASVFVLDRDGVISTPPLDGRILPGVGRELFIEEARREGRPVSERPVSLAEATDAGEVLLVNSLRGVLNATITFD